MSKLAKIDAGNNAELSLSISKLKLYRSITIRGGDCAGDTIHEFWRVSQDDQIVDGIKNTPRTKGIGKELAMIVIKANKESFRVQYYPLDQTQMQVTKELPISDLHIAIEELSQAGF